MCAKILKTVDINQGWYKKDVSLSAKSRSKVIMNKIIGLAVLLFFLSGCVRDNDAIYYPVGNVDVERGGPALDYCIRVILARKNPLMYSARLELSKDYRITM